MSISVDAAPGIRLLLPTIDGARAEPPDALPSVDLSAIAGARVTVRRGEAMVDRPLRLRALCVTAPSDRWAPGAEDLVLDRAGAIARGDVMGAASIERWDAGPARWTGERFDQRFEGAARIGDRTIAIHGRHLLAFTAEEDRAAVLCSALCVDQAPERGGDRRCAALIDAVSMEGTLAPPPPPGLIVRAILFAAERPLPAVAIVAFAVIAVVMLLLARRPRPRPVR